MKNNILQAELKFTETYRKYKDAHAAVREAMCLKEQYPAFFTEIKDGDLFAGRIKHTFVGVTPDEWGPTAFGYYCQEREMRELMTKSDLDEACRQKIEDMLSFWKMENTSSRLRSRYPEEMAKWLPTDDWMHDYGIGFPLYRLTGGNIDFGKLLRLGISGMAEEIRCFKIYASNEGKETEIFEAMLTALDVLIDICLYYAREAKLKAEEESNFERKGELLKMASVLEAITLSKPGTFREALQLFWLYSLAADVRNYGRMDVYMGDFLVNDLNSDLISESEAQKMLDSMWRLMAARNTVVHNRVIIGGKGRSNEKNADRFALMAMEATLNVKEAEPQLSLRFYKGMNPHLMEKALETIGEGRTYPMLYNDDVNIPSVQSAFCLSRTLSEQYVPYGCGEYIIDHKSFGTPSGVINLLKALEVTLHNGVDPATGKKTGLSLGEFRSFDTFDKLWNAYTKQVEHFIGLLARQEELEYKVAGETAPFLYLSMLYDGCLEKGLGAFQGGIDYLGGTLETYGNSNTADSLTAIKKLVYDEKRLSHEDLLRALDHNFEGFEEERSLMLECPKYGNDDECADSMLLKVDTHAAEYTRSQKDKTNLHSYLIVIINNSANTLLGHQTSASADGRKSGEPMNNGNAPSSGFDRQGVTAMLNSIVKPSTYIHAGAVQNMKFSRDMFTKKRSVAESLLKTYFEKGGAQAMITVVNRNDLENAMKEPEKYGHIFVRVGGFSARFVELSRDVQMEILNRTLY
ncbi:MAG TPA: pyruvate formate lyase family protein [Ignavibacteriales bacterium]|nr:pyruvate formate lyase family protein [Ignavibacteriales bacterium]